MLENILKKKKLIIFITLFVLFILWILFIKQPEIPRSESPYDLKKEEQIKEPASWDQITPGKSSIDDITGLSSKVILKSQESSTLEGYTTYWVGKNNQDKLPSVLEVNKTTRTVEYAYDFVFDQNNRSVPSYESALSLGSPNLQLSMPSTPGILVYVYLDNGIALEVDTTTSLIWAIRYFVPTSEEQFLSTWGKDLSQSPVNNVWKD